MYSIARHVQKHARWVGLVGGADGWSLVFLTVKWWVDVVQDVLSKWGVSIHQLYLPYAYVLSRTHTPTHPHTHTGYCQWWRVWTTASQFVRAETVTFPSWPDTFTITPVSIAVFT